MLIIRPIGSCRLYRPLKRIRQSTSIKLAKQRDYGFTHTSAEALQALRFIRGEIEFPAKLLPLIARSEDTPGLFEEPDLVEPDAYILELSSAKSVKVGEFSIQLNYATRYFSDFFADRERNKLFFRMSRPEKTAERQVWLETLPSFQAMTTEDREILSAIVMTMEDEDTVFLNLQEIMARIGDKPITIQTHIDTLDAGGNRLKTRSNVISMVKNAAAELNLDVLDPTDLMLTVGQALAMDKGGTDLTHFSPMFNEQFGRCLIEDHVRPQVRRADPDADVASDPDMVIAETLRERLQQDQLAEVSKEIFEQLRQKPESALFRSLAGHVCLAISDYERALEFLAIPDADDEPSEDDRAAMLRCLFELHRPEQALALGRELLEAEVETEEIYWICAVSATELADEDALPFWKMLVQRNECLEVASKAVMTELARRGDTDMLQSWARIIVEACPTNGKAFQSAWRQAIDSGNPAELRKLALLSTHLPLPLLRDFGNDALEKDQPFAVALLIRHGAAALEAKDFQVDPSVATDWATKGMERLEKRDLTEAGKLTQAAFCFYPDSGIVKQAHKAVRLALRDEMRGCWKARDYQRIIELSDLSMSLDFDSDERPRFAGLAHYRLGNFEAAMTDLAAAAKIDPRPIILISLARAAKNAGKLVEELRAFQRMEDAHPDDEKIVALRESRFSKAIQRAVSLVRSSAKADKFEQAMVILRQLRVQSRFVDESGIFDFVHEELRSAFAKTSDQSVREEYARLLVELDDPHSEAYACLAAIALREERLADAEKLLAKASSLPNKATAESTSETAHNVERKAA